MVDRKECCKTGEYPSHESELSRVARVAGQIDGVKKMIAERRYCPEILIQLKAIRSAVKSIESNILKRHLESCVADSFGNAAERDRKIDEIKVLLDKFQG